MIVWAGRGILSALVLVVLLFSTFIVFEDDFSVYHMEFSFLSAVLFSWYFGNRWNNNERIVVDEQTGERYSLKKVHSLFWIPMQYWGVIFSVLGCIYAVQEGWLIGSIAICAVLIFIGLIIKKKESEKDFQDGPTTHSAQEKTTRTDEITEVKEENDSNNHSRFMPK